MGYSAVIVELHYFSSSCFRARTFLKQLVITLYFIDLVHILIFHFTDITQDDIKRLWVILLKLICRLGFGSPSTVPVKGLQHYMHV